MRKKPDVSHMRVFGCLAYAHIPEDERRKLDKKAVKLRLVGYVNNAMGIGLDNEENLSINQSFIILYLSPGKIVSV